MNIDPDFHKVSLLLPLDNVSTFSDKSYRTKSITNTNVVMSGATKVWGTQSAYFEGWNAFLKTPQNTEFDFGTGDFCIEFWVYMYTTTPDFRTAFMGSGNTTYIDGCSVLGWGATSMSVTLKTNVSGVNTTVISPNIVSLGGFAWKHVAVTRSGDTFRVFYGGVQQAQATYAGAINFSTGGTVVGGTGQSSNTIWGLMQDFRVTKGVARYVSDFPVPQSPYPYTDTPGFIVTWNPNDMHSEAVLSNGNLTVSTLLTLQANRVVRATHAKYGGGRWYFECFYVCGYPANPGLSPYLPEIGLVSKSHPISSTVYIGSSAGTPSLNRTAIGLSARGYLSYCSLGVATVTNQTYTAAARTATIGVAYDLFSGSVWFSVNGVWVGGGVPNAGATPAALGLLKPTQLNPVYPAANNVTSSDQGGPITAHFSEASFTYDPPPGFKSIETPGFDYVLEADNITYPYIGTGEVSGIVTERTIPGAYQVFIHDRETGQLVASTWSGANGAYAFTGLATDREFYVVAFDHTDPIRLAEVVDRVVPS